MDPSVPAFKLPSECSFCQTINTSEKENIMALSLPLISLSWLVLFVGLMVVRAVFLRLTQGINVLTIAKGKKGLAWLAELVFLPFLLVWMAEIVLIGLGVNSRLFPAILERPIVDLVSLKVVGIALLAAALVLFAWALVSFGRSWRVGIDEKKPGELVTHGAFAFSRNPIFVCMILAFTGIFLVHGTPVFLAFAVIFTVGVHFQVLQEEQFLLQRHAASYSAYCRRTLRYLGWRRPEVA
jgi:protein-S-isoprenylcysteine O-methyltransferase Ste14